MVPDQGLQLVTLPAVFRHIIDSRIDSVKFYESMVRKVNTDLNIWAVPCKTMSSAFEDSKGQDQPAYLRSDQGLHCGLTKSFKIVQSV